MTKATWSQFFLTQDSVLLAHLCFRQLFCVISAFTSPLYPKAVWCQFLLLPLTFSPHPQGAGIGPSQHTLVTNTANFKYGRKKKNKTKQKTSAIWHLNSKVKHWKQKHKLVLHPKRDSQQRLQQSLQGKMCQIEGMDQLPGL